MGCIHSKRTKEDGKKPPMKSVLDIERDHTAVRYRLGSPEADYVLLKELGSGLSGPVLLATSKADGEKFAIKGLRKSDYYEGKIMLNGEVLVYLQVDHPNIARLVEVLEDEDYVYLVMEFCSGKSLHQRLTQCVSANSGKPGVVNPSFSEQYVVGVVRQMLETLNYCHSNGIAHRDIKLENFVFDVDDECRGEADVKLIDFGFARFCQKDTKMNRLCGSAPYASPELLNGEYTIKSEMWSLGVIVYLLLVGYPPFHGATQDELFAKIRSGIYLPMSERRWGTVSAAGKNFVTSLLTMDYERRLDCDQALKHPWLMGPSPNAIHTRFTSASSTGLEMSDSARLAMLKKYAGLAMFVRLVVRLCVYFMPPSYIRRHALQMDFLGVANCEVVGSIAASSLCSGLSTVTERHPELVPSDSSAPILCENLTQSLNLFGKNRVFFNDWLSPHVSSHAHRASVSGSGSSLGGQQTNGNVELDLGRLLDLVFRRLTGSAAGEDAKLTSEKFLKAFGKSVDASVVTNAFSQACSSSSGMTQAHFRETILKAVRSVDSKSVLGSIPESMLPERSPTQVAA